MSSDSQSSLILHRLERKYFFMTKKKVQLGWIVTDMERTHTHTHKHVNSTLISREWNRSLTINSTIHKCLQELWIMSVSVHLISFPSSGTCLSKDTGTQAQWCWKRNHLARGWRGTVAAVKTEGRGVEWSPVSWPEAFEGPGQPYSNMNSRFKGTLVFCTWCWNYWNIWHEL